MRFFFAVALGLLISGSAFAQQTPLQLLQQQRDQCLSTNADANANMVLLNQQLVAERAYWEAYVKGLPAPPAPEPK